MIYIIAPLIFVGLIILLVSILIIFQKIFSGDKRASIKINDGETVSVEAGPTLLSSLASRDIFVPSACGGKGSCGLCKIQVNKGAGDILPQELPYLSREERKNKIRLSCQIKVNGPIEITLPESLLNAKKYRAEVVETIDISYDIKQLRFRLQGGEAIDFEAGSYIQLIVPEYYEEFRAYSISNAPSEKDTVEIMVRLVKNGLCSTYAHALEKGDTVEFTGPYGDFKLIEDEDTELILVGGGVGMAPIKSLIFYALENFSRKKVSLFFGCRAVKDMIYYDFFKKLSSDSPRFISHYALSEMDPGDEWDGAKGFIHETLNNCMRRSGRRQAFLCGPPPMIHAVTKVLKIHGVPEKNIFWDDFGL